MEKIQIDASKYADMHNEIEVTGLDGTVLSVRNHISMANRMELAQDAARMTLRIHDDSAWYETPEKQANVLYLFAKYYTNLDTENLTPGDVTDFMINNELYGQLKEGAAWDDYALTLDMYHDLKWAAMDVFDNDRSISKAIRTSFPFLFTGEDVIETLAKAEATSDTLFRAIGALRREEKEEQQKVDNGTVEVGGVVLNLRPRE